MRLLVLALGLTLCSCASDRRHAPGTAGREGGPVKYARFAAPGGGVVSYGVVEGDRVRAISGEPFRRWERTGKTYPLADVKLLAPVVPRKVFALAGNYRSHLGDRPVPTNPEPFFKLPTSIAGPGERIVIPPGTADVHYEAELVLVIGRRAKDLSADAARSAIFGVTCGNDVSARDWQDGDVQWWRAKGCDTFGPIGPFVVSGVDYDDLLLELRHNGQTKQSQRTSDLIFDAARIVSFISRHVTLEPGDVIFTGTPGETAPIKPGDVVEVELEGVGVLRNTVAAPAGAGAAAADAAAPRP